MPDNYSYLMSADKGRALFILECHAHGFQTLEADTEISHSITEMYHPNAGDGVRWNDPIVASEELAASAPDYALLLVWNFADEVMVQQQAYRDAGGKFAIPLPVLRLS